MVLKKAFDNLSLNFSPIIVCGPLYTVRDPILRKGVAESTGLPRGPRTENVKNSWSKGPGAGREAGVTKPLLPNGSPRPHSLFCHATKTCWRPCHSIDGAFPSPPLRGLLIGMETGDSSFLSETYSFSAQGTPPRPPSYFFRRHLPSPRGGL